MSEVHDAINKAQEKRRQAEQGKGMDPNRLAGGAYDPKWEQHVLSLPLYSTHQTRLQNPDGTFKFMAGLDGIGVAPVGT